MKEQRICSFCGELLDENDLCLDCDPPEDYIEEEEHYPVFTDWF